jgi:hypothetical protein
MMQEQDRIVRLLTTQFDRIVSMRIKDKNDLILLKRRLTNLIKFTAKNRNLLFSLVNKNFKDFIEGTVQDNIFREVLEKAISTEFGEHQQLRERLLRYYLLLYSIKYKYDKRGFILGVTISPKEHYMTALSRWMGAVNEARSEIISSQRYDPTKASERWKRIYLNRHLVVKLGSLYNRIIEKRLSYLDDDDDAPYWPFFEYGNQKKSVPGDVGGKPFPINQGKRIFSTVTDNYNREIKRYRITVVKNFDKIIDSLIETATNFRQSLTDIKSLDAFMKSYRKLSEFQEVFQTSWRKLI